MKVFSSYYDKTPQLHKDDYTFVRVSCKPPEKWFFDAIKEYEDLSKTFGPTEEMLVQCHPTVDWEAFKPRYENEILGVLDKGETLDLLEKIQQNHGGLPLLLMCFEAPPDNCHRHLIGEFLGIEVEEI